MPLSVWDAFDAILVRLPAVWRDLCNLGLQVKEARVVVRGRRRKEHDIRAEEFPHDRDEA